MLKDVLGIDCSLHGRVVSVDEALGIEEGQYHLLFLHGMGLSHEWLSLALLQPPFRLLLWFRSVEGLH